MDRYHFKPGFHTPLVFEDDGGLPFTLTQALTYVSDVFVEGQALAIGTLMVPAGFKTDLASIPRGLWNVLPPVGKYDRAAVVHDLLYQSGRVNGLRLERRHADAVLNEAMTASGVGRLTRWLVYAGVRVGGWAVWNKYRSKEKA
jgi:hypothetical protein